MNNEIVNFGFIRNFFPNIHKVLTKSFVFSFLNLHNILYTLFFIFYIVSIFQFPIKYYSYYLLFFQIFKFIYIVFQNIYINVKQKRSFYKNMFKMHFANKKVHYFFNFINLILFLILFESYYSNIKCYQFNLKHQMRQKFQEIDYESFLEYSKYNIQQYKIFTLVISFFIFIIFYITLY